MNKFIIFFLIIALLVTGCTSKDNNEVEPQESLAYEMNVSTDIDGYSVFMSSVPGMPINIDAVIYDESANLQLIITTDNGQLLLWKNQNIDNLKNEYVTDFEDKTVYWTPMNETDNQIIEEATVLIKIFDKDLDEITLTYIGSIELVDDTTYKIKYDIEE
jgi:outer membrane lipoprotein-sorting protein